MDRRDLFGLFFHGIGTPHEWVDADERKYWCTENEFLKIIDQIPFVQDEAGVKISITFDDGNISDVAVATPALAARGLRAEFFACAGRIGKAGYLDGSAMVEMCEAGMSIGCHGWSHLDWRRVDNKTLLQETKDARERIAEAIGRPVDNAAIPFGSYDRRVLDALKSYKTVYSSDAVRARAGQRPFPRFSYNVNWAEDTLMKLATEHYGIARLLRDNLKRQIKSHR